MFVPLEKLLNLEEGYRQRFVVQGTPVILMVIEGRHVLFEDRCPHQGAPLFSGAITAATIRCPRHGFEFDVFTGQALSVSCQRLRLLDLAYDHDRIGIDC
jgi:nitrite reductase/ring-hydroxylating ferredoxin subunit